MQRAQVAGRLSRATAFAAIAVLCCAAAASAQTQPQATCGVQSGALDATLAKLNNFTAPLFANGLAGAKVFAVSYAGFRAVLVGIEALPELRSGIVVYLKLIGRVILPLALTLVLIQSIPTLWPALLNGASTLMSTTGGSAVGTVSPSVVIGEFGCLAADVNSAGLLSGITGNIGGYLSSYVTSNMLVLSGFIIAGALLFFLAKAAITVPVGAPMLGGLVGPDGKSVSMGYVTHCITVLIEVATVTVLVSVAEQIAADPSLAPGGNANLLSFEVLSSISILLAIFAWGLPIVAGRVLGSGVAVTFVSTVSMAGRALNSARQVGQQVAAGVGTGGASTAASAGAAAASAAAGAAKGAASGAGRKGAEIFGRELP